MSLFGIARGLGVLGLQVWDAASFILRPDRPFFEPRDGAERLAEMEAEQEVFEPDCGLGFPVTTAQACASVVSDGIEQWLTRLETEVAYLRDQLTSATPASSRTAVEQADGPEVEVSPTPSTSGHLTFGTDPSAMYERMLRQHREEDRD